MPQKYFSIRHPEYRSLKIRKCYLCDKLLSVPINKDHIIPNSLFPKSAEDRPQLPVHKSCNSDKTKDDRKFKTLMLLTAGSTSPYAKTQLDELTAKVQGEREHAYLIGHKVPNYKFVKGLAKGISPRKELLHRGQHLIEIDLGDANSELLKSYFRMVLKGLFIRNIIDADPKPVSNIMYIDKRRLTQSQLDNYWSALSGLIKRHMDAGMLAGQVWPGHIAYYCLKADEPHSGMVVLEFYETYIVSGTFEP